MKTQLRPFPLEGRNPGQHFRVIRGGGMLSTAIIIKPHEKLIPDLVRKKLEDEKVFLVALIDPAESGETLTLTNDTSTYEIAENIYVDFDKTKLASLLGGIFVNNDEDLSSREIEAFVLKARTDSDMTDGSGYFLVPFDPLAKMIPIPTETFLFENYRRVKPEFINVIL